MENGAFDMLKRIYRATSTPVAVANVKYADTKYNILWKNPAAEASEVFEGDTLCFVPDTEGSQSVFVNGAYRIFNVMKCEAEDEVFVVEYIGKDNSRDLSHMRNYFSFVSMRLRESASQISMSTDDIDMFLKNGDTNVAASLNKINRNVMLLLKEALVPENIFYAAECKDEPINLAHAVAHSAEDAQTALGRQSEVWQNDVDNVCAKINPSVFDAVIAHMTAQVCGGELYPERVEYVVDRENGNENKGFVSVRSVCLSERRNNPFRLEAMKGEFFTDVSLRDVLAGKYGISFETKRYPDGIECIMHLDVLPINKGIVRTDGRIPRQERFSSMAISLSERHCAERYKNIKSE